MSYQQVFVWQNGGKEGEVRNVNTQSVLRSWKDVIKENNEIELRVREAAQTKRKRHKVDTIQIEIGKTYRVEGIGQIAFFVSKNII